MSFFKYWTRVRANRLGVASVERGKACLAARDPTGAEVAFQEALEALTWAHGDGHIETIAGTSGLAAAAGLASQWDRATTFTERTVALTEQLPRDDPRRAEALLNRLQLEWQVGELRRLIGTTTAILALPAREHHAHARLHLALAYRWLHDFDAARQHGAAMVADGGSAENSALLLAGVEVAAEAWDAADAAYRAILDGEGSRGVRASARSRHATVLAALGRADEARAQLAAAQAEVDVLPEGERRAYGPLLALDRARTSGRQADYEALWDLLLTDRPPTHCQCLDAARACAAVAEPGHRAHRALREHAGFVLRVYPSSHPLVAAVGGR